MKKTSLSLVRFLDFVERAGNRLPDPLTLFFLFSLAVVLVSSIAASLGVAVRVPGSDQVVAAQSLLEPSQLRRILTDMVKNFALFPPLGLVLVTMIGIGVAERTGLITTALKRLVTTVPRWALTFTVVFAGIMSSMAADAGYVVLTPLGAVLFLGFGRHPLAGLAAAFAGVSAGFSANLLLTSLDPLLSGISTKAAQIVNPDYVVQPSANYYLMVVSTLLLSLAGAFITSRIVEPRLGKYEPARKVDEEVGVTGALTDRERRGLVLAGLTALLFAAVVALLVLPSNGVLRDPEHGLRPFYESLVALLMIGFLASGLVYGLVVGNIKSDKDVARMSADSMASLGAYIVLAFAAAQFVAYFGWSNLGVILAVSGAETLKSVGFTGVPLILAFIVVSAFINIFIGSASAKWAVMGPVFVPMLMLMGYSPELVQAAYRVGDSVTNIISPLLPYFPVIIAFARKYSPQAGLGTLVSLMLPYSIGFGLVWTLMFVVWVVLGIPLGPDAPLEYSGVRVDAPR